MPMTPDQFRKAMSYFATGVSVVTTRDLEGKPYGLTVNSFTSVSLDPLLVLVCLDNQLSGLEAFQQSNQFGVNILAEDQQDLSVYFSRTGTDRSLYAYVSGETGIPLLEGVLATMECEIVARYPSGDHTILVGEVKRAEIVDGEKRPLVYYQGSYRRVSYERG